MRKLATLVVIAAVALGAPNAVGAAKKMYSGGFELSGTLDFAVKKNKSGKRVVNFRFAQFPLVCESGPQTTTDNLNFAVRVRRGKFETVGLRGNPGNPQSKLSLKGKLQGKSDASGTMKIEGRKVPVDSGGSQECTSNKTTWTASRNA